MTQFLPEMERPSPSARSLNQWVRDAVGLTGETERRIGWLLSSTVAIAALQRAMGADQSPLFWVKGGVYLEMRLARARATKDVDTVFRGQVEQLRSTLHDALSLPWGPFQIDYSELQVITGAQRPEGLKPVRLDMRLWLKGAIWRKVRVEVSFPEGKLTETADPVPAPPTGFFGIDVPDQLAGIVMDYQVAQKMHAASDPDLPDYTNERVRDVIDLLLVKHAFYPENPPSLKTACLDLFAARVAEARQMGKPPRHWPPILHANDTWHTLYPELADSVGLELSLNEAIQAVHQWIAEIDITSNIP
ncbi:MAG: nucleotidyl transferase AbiEii/AbiGii toxin family protein [Bifidobacteriaceae bacterium]|jgi:hypothetical protein|nr:nucleotidyl transferase AbiEii/AbiGii toxin family protein [Bifidobacteriaceae bacterium]